MSLLGRFHELSLATGDIRASCEFWERLGFEPLATTDAFDHRYGAYTDGRIHVGLHERRAPAFALSFVRAGLAGHLADLAAAGLEPHECRLGAEDFHQLSLRDPGGHEVRLLEARTHGTPPARASSLLGWFSEVALPSADPQRASTFWERLGFIAHEPQELPWMRWPLTIDGLELSLQRPRILDQPALVFRDGDARERLVRLRELGLVRPHGLPAGLDSEANGVVETPEGVCLLLLEGDP